MFNYVKGLKQKNPFSMVVFYKKHFLGTIIKFVRNRFKIYFWGVWWLEGGGDYKNINYVMSGIKYMINFLVNLVIKLKNNF